jgi:hypothetical protein
LFSSGLISAFSRKSGNISNRRYPAPASSPADIYHNIRARPGASGDKLEIKN